MKFCKGLLLSLLLLASSNCYAVTEFISVINKAGSEDFNTLTLWEAAMDDAGDITDGTVKTGNWDAKTGSIPADGTAMDWDGGASTGTLIHASENNTGSGGDQYLIDVTGGSLADNDVLLDVSTSTDGFTIAGAPDSAIITAECFDDDGDLDDSFTIDGLTTNATNFIKVTSPIGERHSGVESDGSSGNGFLIDYSGGNTHMIGLTDDYTVISWIQATRSGVSDQTIIIGFDATGILILNNIVRDATLSRSGIRSFRNVGQPTMDTVVANNIVYNIIGDGIELAGASADNEMFVYNNTVYNCSADGIKEDNGVMTAKNNISYNNNIDFVSVTTEDYNFSKDDSASGANSIQGDTDGKTPDFVSVAGGSEDFHLQASSDAIDVGTDLGTTPLGVQFDIDNDDRDTLGVTWDIGADERVVVAAGVIKTFNGVIWANIKTINGVAVGSIKTYNGKATQ